MLLPASGDSRGRAVRPGIALPRVLLADISNAPSRKSRGQVSNVGTPQQERAAGTQPLLEAPGGPAALSPARLRLVMLVLAAACGMAVANIYSSQPLLGHISSTF